MPDTTPGTSKPEDESVPPTDDVKTAVVTPAPDNGSNKPTVKTDALPKTKWEILVWLIKNPKYFFVCVALLAFLVFLYVSIFATVRYYGYDLQSSFPFLTRSVEGMQKGILKDAIQEGIKRQADYVMESVTYMVRITDVTNIVTDTNGMTCMATNRLINSRIVYVLRALKDISANENTTFAEIYSSPYATELRYWPGSDLEKSRTGGGTVAFDPYHYYSNQFVKYNVFFNAQMGDTHTIVTGADETLALPFPDQRVSRDVLLRKNEDVVLYPNDDDVIGELTIIIESDTTHFVPMHPLRFNAGAKSAPVDDGQVTMSESGDPADKSHPSTSVISARWRMVMPGEKVGLQFRWGEGE